MLISKIWLICAHTAYCIDYKNQQPAEPLKNYEIPTTPWIKVSTDIFHLFGKSYVTIIDYTRFTWNKKLSDKNCNQKSKKHLPNSAFHKQLSVTMDQNSIQQNLRHLQKNGICLRIIWSSKWQGRQKLQTIKKILKKVFKSGEWTTTSTPSATHITVKK